jgi:hypothetical protein
VGGGNSGFALPIGVFVMKNVAVWIGAAALVCGLVAIASVRRTKGQCPIWMVR